MILIDAIYPNSYGGKTILELFLEKSINSSLRYHYLIDNRLDSNLLKAKDQKDFTIIKASHKNRKNFYKQNINKFSSITCLSNVSPPITSKINTTIFFHNILLLNPFENSVSFKTKLFSFF